MAQDTSPLNGVNSIYAAKNLAHLFIVPSEPASMPQNDMEKKAEEIAKGKLGRQIVNADKGNNQKAFVRTLRSLEQ